MFFEATTLIGVPIVCRTNPRKLGEVEDFIVEPETGRVAAVLIQKKTFFHEALIISPIDIIHVRPDVVVVNDEDSVVSASDIVRVKDIIDQKIEIFNSEVETESGKSLGKVEDYVIESPSFHLARIYVRGGIIDSALGRDTIIIPNDMIVKINPGKIIVSDDIEKKEKVEEIEVARLKAMT